MPVETEPQTWRNPTGQRRNYVPLLFFQLWHSLFWVGYFDPAHRPEAGLWIGLLAGHVFYAWVGWYLRKHCPWCDYHIQEQRRGCPHGYPSEY